MQIPILHTERLVLLPPSPDCEDLYDAFYTDADASASYGGPLTSAGAWSRLAADLGGWYLQGFGIWAIQRRDTGDCWVCVASGKASDGRGNLPGGCCQRHAVPVSRWKHRAR